MTSVKLLIWMTAFCATAATTNVTTTNVTTPKTVLVVKEVHTYDGSKTVSRQGSFMALLEYNKAFIDKTLLIKEVLEQEEKVVLINRPRRWGKTANLGMIGTFLEMQLDNHHRIIQPKEEASNYRLFKKGELMFRKGKIDKLREPLLISRYQQYMDEYQGQYPVIEVNFEAWLSGTYIGMEKTMRHRMSDIFFEFKYMKDILEKVIDGDEASNKQKIQAKKSLDHFKLIQKSKGSVEETKTALIFLSELLHWHFKKPVVILVNEYDTPLINVVNDRGITTEDKYRFIDYYQDFIWKTFKQNSFLKKGILTGILRIFKADVLYSAQYKHKYAYVDDPFFEFYGFTDVEAEWLLDYYNISQQARAEVRDWCCGYHAYGIGSPSVCLPLSFVRYILSGQLANYWVETGNEVGNVKGFVDIPVFREALLLLVYGNEFIINLEDLHFNIDDYMEFQRYVNVTEVPEANATHFVSLAFRYLWGHGYLTYSHRTGPKLLDMFNLTDSNPNVTQVRLKFPNREISKYLGSYIVEYYEDKLDIDYISSFNMNNLRNEFKKFVTSEDHRSYKLEEFFEDFFTLLSSALDKVIFVEEYAPGLLNYLALLVDGVQKLGFQEKPYIGRPDMILHLPDRVVVIEYVLDGKTGQGALKRALQYENLIKQSGITNRIKFIGISVTMLKKVSIYAQVKKV